MSVLLLSLAGCGAQTTFDKAHYQVDEDPQISGILERVEAYFNEIDQLPLGSLQGTVIYKGSSEDVAQDCGYPKEEICGCFLFDTIFIDSLCPHCQIIAHELGHKVSFILHGESDGTHQRYGLVEPISGEYRYYFPIMICGQIYERN